MTRIRCPKCEATFKADAPDSKGLKKRDKLRKLMDRHGLTREGVAQVMRDIGWPNTSKCVVDSWLAPADASSRKIMPDEKWLALKTYFDGAGK